MLGFAALKGRGGTLGGGRDDEEAVDHRVDLFRYVQLAEVPGPAVLPYRISGTGSWKRAMVERGRTSSAAM
jgi:hypothetical protein